ncbi:hypothetical protein V6767_07280 [Martelella sp. FLE1502]
MNIDSDMKLDDVLDSLWETVEQGNVDKDFSLSPESQIRLIGLLVNQTSTDMRLFAVLLAIASGRKPTEEIDAVLRNLEDNRDQLKDLLKNILKDMDKSDA